MVNEGWCNWGRWLMGNRASSGGCVYAPAPLTASSRRKRRRMGVGRRDQHVALETVWAVSVWAGSLVGSAFT